MSTCSFLEIAGQHLGELRAYAHQLTRDYDAAEDALQDCLIQCAETWPEHRLLSEEDVRRYVGAAIRNRLRPKKQRTKVYHADVSNLPPWEQPVASPICLISPELRLQAERARDDARMDLIRDILLEARQHLTNLESDCFELSLANYNQKQIAELLGVNHVKAHRALVKAKFWVVTRFGERYATLLAEAAEDEDPFDFPV